MTPDACAALVERGDPDRFLAARAASPAARTRLFPLYAFNLEVARAPWVTSEPVLAEIRLQWWREALDEIFAGKAPRAHEVVGPLAEVIRRAGLPRAPFDALIDARAWDIGRAPFADAAALGDHLDATAGNLMWLGALALGAPAAAEPVVRDLGAASGLANWLVAVPALLRNGRAPLPDPASGAVARLARDGLDRLAAARRRRRALPAAALPALLSAWQAGPLLRQALRDPARVLAGGLGLSEFHRRGGLALRGMSGRW